jgi:hypothetical protein
MGHLKNGYRMDRNYLSFRDATNAILAALRLILAALVAKLPALPHALPESAFFTVDYLSLRFRLFHMHIFRVAAIARCPQVCSE